MTEDVRWLQRFSSFNKALAQLQSAVQLSHSRELTLLEKQGLILCFEYTHELSWKVMKDFLESRGNIEIFGSKDATKEAFRLGLISSGEIWMSMIQSRNQTSHIYDEKTVREIVDWIVGKYLIQFELLKSKLSELAEQK